MSNKTQHHIFRMARKTQSFWIDVALLVVTLALLLGLFMFKASNLGFGYSFVFAYAVLITIFQLFRLFAAVLFPAILEHTSYANKETIKDYWPKVTVVVPCKNEEGAIAHTLTKCFEAHYPAELLEVIVINDGSTDNTRAEIQKVKDLHPQLIVIDWETNKGKREGMAAGFRIATGEIVVQLDSDSYIEPATFRHMIIPFHNPTVGAVCGHADVANAKQNFITKMQAGYYFVAFRILKAAESVFASVFCCSG